MAKHNKCLNKYEDGFENIAIELGDLTYDSLAIFLDLLSQKLDKDSQADGERNRKKLSYELLEASKKIKEASVNIETAWKICEPYM